MLSPDVMVQTIVSQLRAHRAELAKMYKESTPVHHCYLDNVLPAEHVRELAQAFPDPNSLLMNSTIRERKRFGVDIKKYDAHVGEALFAFRHPDVIKEVAEITGIKKMEGDPTMYAGGISVMGKGDFLNPHLDNSHDGDIQRYRVINILYYVSPDWKLENGGNLEVWDTSVTKPTTIVSAFNRVVIMETDQRSWHSVSKVVVDQPRRCVSNYYFSIDPPGGKPFRHMTTFTGRPEEPFKRIYLALADGVAKNLIGKLFPGLTKATRHRAKTAAAK